MVEDINLENVPDWKPGVYWYCDENDNVIYIEASATGFKEALKIDKERISEGYNIRWTAGKKDLYDYLIKNKVKIGFRITDKNKCSEYKFRLLKKLKEQNKIPFFNIDYRCREKTPNVKS